MSLQDALIGIGVGIPNQALHAVPAAGRIKTSGVHRLSDLQCQSDSFSKYHQLPGIPGDTEQTPVHRHRHHRSGRRTDQSRLIRMIITTTFLHFYFYRLPECPLEMVHPK